MKYTNSTTRLISRIVLLAGLICPVLTNAQDRARDMDPEMALLRAQTRNAADPMVIRGMMGPLDYENAKEVSAQLAEPLFLSVDPNPEPLEAILKYQSRGQRVEINWDFLDSLRDGVESRVLVPFFDGRDRELVFVHSEYRGPNRYSWFGQIAGVAASDFILVRHDDAVFMTIRDYQYSLNYEVMFTPAFGDTPAGHALRKVADAAPPAKCGTCDGSVKHHHHASTHADGVSDEGHIGSGGSGGSGSQGAGGGGYGPRAATDPTHVIDVMVLCTAQALAGFGSFNAFVATAQACVDDTNVRNNNSGSGLTLRLMAADPAANGYNENADGGTELSHLAYRATTLLDNGSGGTFAPDPSGILDNVHSLRTLFRADLVALIRENGWGSNGSIAGVAYRPDRASDVFDIQTATAFSVNARNHGSVPLVGDIFAHEIGHNLGGCHDDAQNGCGANQQAITSSPRGIVISCNAGFCYDYWHSTMAYGPRGCFEIRSTLLPAWSNPNTLVDLAWPCPDQYLGNSTSNVTNMIQATRRYISQYRIAASQSWAWPPMGNGGNGTRYSPYGRIRSAVNAVQGGSAEAVVQVFGGTFDETASNGGPVLLSNPCKLQSVDGSVSNIR